MNLFRRTLFPSPMDAEGVRSDRRSFLSMLCACCAVPFMPSLAHAALISPEIESHILAAKAAAGKELQSYLALTEIVIPNPNRGDGFMALLQRPIPEPLQIFDNLYYVGSEFVCCWAITGPDEIILIDAMNNDDEAQNVVERGLIKLGLDPSKVKSIFVTHAHGDHYGGAPYFKRKYGADIYMGAKDWDFLASGKAPSNKVWGPPPARDKTVKEGDVFQVGNSKIEIFDTPGHTVGTISLTFDVFKNGASSRVMLWGGTAFNFGRAPDRLDKVQDYIEQTERMRAMVDKEGIELLLSNHPFYDATTEKIEALRNGDERAFVMGPDLVKRALTVMNECAKATYLFWKQA